MRYAAIGCMTEKDFTSMARVQSAIGVESMRLFSDVIYECMRVHGVVLCHLGSGRGRGGGLRGYPLPSPRRLLDTDVDNVCSR